MCTLNNIFKCLNEEGHGPLKEQRDKGIWEMLPCFMKPLEHIPRKAVPFVCNNQAKNIFSL